MCREGYYGRKCNYCAEGFYGFPNCQSCNCDIRGTKVETTYNDIIDCDDNGQCPCKDLATGLKCNECRQSTFGLSLLNPNGCTRCFCFGRSQTCSQNDLFWGQIRMMGPRNILKNFDNDNYIILSHTRNNQIYREKAYYTVHDDLILLPGYSGDITILGRESFHNPLYIELPKDFIGDKTSSYGGYLNFSITTYDAKAKSNENMYQSFPLVQMHTHYHLTLNYFYLEPLNQNTFNVILHESYWKHASNGRNISRAIMLTALQNLKHIYVRVSLSSDFAKIT